MMNDFWYTGTGLGIFIVLLLAVLIFWVWMFVDMWQSRRIKKETKVILTILFLATSIITAIMWAIFRKRI